MAHTAAAMATVEDFLKEWLSDCDYIAAHTSGSTGAPKEIKLLKDDMRASARATNERFKIDSHSVIAYPLSTDYIAGKMMEVRAMEAGCRIIRMPVSNNVEISSDIDLLAVVPSQVESLLQASDLATKVKNIIIGGAPLCDDLATRLYYSGVNAFATYGMTETCSHVALAKITDGEKIFEAMPGISFEKDQRDCLVINAPSFSFKKIITNDIVELIDDRKFKWLGRFDNVINSGGIKIFPETLEKEIQKWIDKPFYITSEKDSKWGEVPVIVFEGEPTQEKDIIALLRSYLDHRRCPSRSYAVEKLTRTPNGKIIRKPLPFR